MDVGNLVVISDTHFGCQFALCPNTVRLDGGGTYRANYIQKRLASMWEDYWKWVKHVATKGEPYAVVHLGDSIDGVHHKSNHQISQNYADQVEIAYQMLAPVVDDAVAYYAIRGTEAHVGQSAQYEEILARRLGAKVDQQGNSSRFELFAHLSGKGGPLAHFSHHIGTTGRNHYESSAVMAELAEMFTESGRWGKRPPDVVCRGHRHRCIEVRVPTHNTYGIAFTAPAWQLKTPFAYKVPGGRVSQPQIGGSVIRHGDDDFVYTRHWIRSVERPNAA